MAYSAQIIMVNIPTNSTLMLCYVWIQVSIGRNFTHAYIILENDFYLKKKYIYIYINGKKDIFCIFIKIYKYNKLFLDYHNVNTFLLFIVSMSYLERERERYIYIYIYLFMGKRYILYIH